MMNPKPTDLSSLFYHNPLPIWIYERENFNIIEVNQAALTHYGYVREEFLTLRMNDLLIEGQSRAVIDSHTLISSESGNNFFGIFKHRKKTGAGILVELNGHLVGKCTLVICQDITEREMGMKELKKTEERLRTATEIAHVGYWRYELETGDLSWSGEVYRIWDLDQKSFDLNYVNLLETLHPDDRDSVEEGHRRAFEDQRESDMVYRIYCSGGVIRWIREQGRLLKDKAGNILAIEGTVQDITLQKREESRLKLLESVVTHTSDAILITEAEPFDEPGNRIVYVNEAFTKMTGYTSEEVIGRSPRLLQGPNTDKKETAKLGRALRNWESCEATLLNYRKNGEEFWLTMAISPVANEKGWFTHWIAIEKEVTEQKNKAIEQSLLSQISQIFNEETSLLPAGHRLCSLFADFGTLEFVELWLPNLENTQIRLISTYQSPKFAKQSHPQFKEAKVFKHGEGIPGEVLETGKTLLWHEKSDRDFFKRREATRSAGIATVWAMPLVFQGRAIGVLVCGSKNDPEYVNRSLTVFERLQSFIASEINRKALETNLNRFFETQPDVVCVMDFSGRFLKINSTGCEMLGYRKDDILFYPCEEFIHPEDREVLFSQLKKMREGESTIKFDNRFLTKNGEIIWLNWTYKSSMEEGIIYATAKNITNEKKLFELNTQASSLARIGSWEIDLIKEKLFWTEMVHSLHETDPETYVPDFNQAINFYREDFRELILCQIKACITKREPFNFEAVIITAKNNERWIRIIGRGEYLGGKCTRIFGSFQDIHDKKDAEIRLQSLADNLPGVVFQYLMYPDGKDKLKFVSKGSEQIWGYPSEAVVENNLLVWNQIKAGGDFETVAASIAESTKNKTKWTAKWRYVMPNGETKTHSGIGTPTFLADGTVIFNSLVLDITEERKTEELLKQASALARIGSWELDFATGSMYWSPMTREVFGVEESYNPTPSRGLEFYTGESGGRLKEALEKLIATGESFDIDLQLITANGHKRWVRCIGKCERVKGDCVKVYGSFQDIHAAKSLELQVTEILESISDAFFALDKHWNVTYWNKRAEEIIGVKREDLRGHNLWEKFPQAKELEFFRQYESAFKNQQPVSFVEYYPPLGQWYETNVYPSPEGISVFFRDITDKKTAEELIVKANERFEKAAEATNDAIWDWDIENNTFSRSKGFENFLGSNAQNSLLEEKFFKGSFYSEDLAKLQTSVREALDDPNTFRWEMEYRIFKESGKLGYVVDRGVIIRDDTGKAIRMVGAMTDVSSLIEAQQQIVNAKERFEKVSKATNDAIWDWNIKEQTLYWGDGFKTLFGYDVDNITPTLDFWTSLVHPEDLPEVYSSLMAVVENPDAPYWQMEYRYKRSDGTYAFVIDRGVTIRDSAGTAVQMVGAVNDISQRKKQEEELIALNESLKKHAHALETTNDQLEQFAYIASHDLQEPLRMITSFLNQLKRKYGNQLDEKAHQYIHFATDGAQRMKQIILDLLDYSRAGKFQEKRKLIDPNSLISDYKSLRKNVIAEKSATIRHTELPLIEGYKAPLTQVIHCLLDNAIKYSRNDIPPWIEFKIDRTEREWVFSVKDNGLGIDPQFFERIFIIFQRLHNRDEYSGTGIGLSIVKKQVESWGGRVWVDSVPEEGSTFFFTIPD